MREHIEVKSSSSETNLSGRHGKVLPDDPASPHARPPTHLPARPPALTPARSHTRQPGRAQRSYLHELQQKRLRPKRPRPAARQPSPLLLHLLPYPACCRSDKKTAKTKSRAFLSHFHSPPQKTSLSLDPFHFPFLSPSSLHPLPSPSLPAPPLPFPPFLRHASASLLARLCAATHTPSRNRCRMAGRWERCRDFSSRRPAGEVVRRSCAWHRRQDLRNRHPPLACPFVISAESVLESHTPKPAQAEMASDKPHPGRAEARTVLVRLKCHGFSSGCLFSSARVANPAEPPVNIHT